MIIKLLLIKNIPNFPSHFIQLFFNENYGLSVFATNNRSFDNFYKNIDKRDFTYFN